MSQIADIGPLPDYQEYNVTYPGLKEKIGKFYFGLTLVDYSLAMRNDTQGAFVSYNTKLMTFEIVNHEIKVNKKIHYPKKFNHKNIGWKDIVYMP